MTDYRDRYDIVISSGARQFEALQRLLPLLRGRGRVHVASCGLTVAQESEVEAQCDELHRPKHDPDPYVNFKLFCIRDINQLASAPYFIKLDTDVQLRDDWIDYVDEALSRFPEAVLIGPVPGRNLIDYDISGALVRERFGTDIRVRKGVKISGSFYIGSTSFFKQHDPTMQILHDFIYAFRHGRRVRTSHLREEDSEAHMPDADLVSLRGACKPRQGKASEDNLRSLTVHFVGASSRLVAFDSRGRVSPPADAVPLPPAGLVKKFLKSRGRRAVREISGVLKRARSSGLRSLVPGWWR